MFVSSSINFNVPKSPLKSVGIRRCNCVWGGGEGEGGVVSIQKETK